MSIVLESISKHYGNQWVVDNVTLEVADRELFVLLGSSGSGKSTILRMIAGLTEPTGGKVLLHGRDVTALAPQERGVGFVFQNYSIFRHMSVAENIEFGLKIRKAQREERKRRREHLLDMVGLSGLGSRYAHQLSGGQQQRVALARALAYEPKVLLLDEPFGALDVKIRAQLRRSLKEIQRELGVTTIVVTHDQEEAFELADRIGVLERGRLLEVGAGESLYNEPRSLFAATFLGAGTVLVGRAEKGQARFGSLALPIPDETPHEEGERVQLLFRPEQVILSADPPDAPSIGKGKVVEQSFAGAVRRVRLRLPHIQGTRQIAPALPFGEEGLFVDAVLSSETFLQDGELWVGLCGWTILNRAEPRLLVYDEGADSSSLLAVAQVLAERLEASLTVLVVADGPEAAEALRLAFNKRQDESGSLQAELRVRYGNPAEQIAAEQAESLYEMLILAAPVRAKSSSQSRMARLPGLEARTRIRRLGETFISVLQHADIPMLLVKGEKTDIERVLICTAAGEPGKNDVIVGGRLAQRLGALPTLLHVTRDRDDPKVTRKHLDRAVAALRALDLEGDARVRHSATAASGILEEVKEKNHDLIVLGSYGPRSKAFFDLNKVMLQVASDVDRSVLVVPTDRV